MNKRKARILKKLIPKSRSEYKPFRLKASKPLSKKGKRWMQMVESQALKIFNTKEYQDALNKAFYELIICGKTSFNPVEFLKKQGVEL